VSAGSTALAALSQVGETIVEDLDAAAQGRAEALLFVFGDARDEVLALSELGVAVAHQSSTTRSATSCRNGRSMPRR
jgi:hypothetical protein